MERPVIHPPGSFLRRGVQRRSRSEAQIAELAEVSISRSLWGRSEARDRSQGYGVGIPHSAFWFCIRFDSGSAFWVLHSGFCIRVLHSGSAFRFCIRGSAFGDGSQFGFCIRVLLGFLHSGFCIRVLIPVLHSGSLCIRSGLHSVLTVPHRPHGLRSGYALPPPHSARQKPHLPRGATQRATDFTLAVIAFTLRRCPHQVCYCGSRMPDPVFPPPAVGHDTCQSIHTPVCLMSDQSTAPTSQQEEDTMYCRYHPSRLRW